MLDRSLTVALMLISLILFQDTIHAQENAYDISQTAIASEPAQKIPSIQDDEMRPKSLQVLANATVIDSSHIGYAATPGQNHLAYQEAKSLGMSIYSQLQDLQANATPVGQLYLAALIRNLNPEKGTQLIKDLSFDNTKIHQISGCIMFATTVKDVATELLKTPTAFD